MLERICERPDQTRAGSCLCDLVWLCAVKAEGSVPPGSFKMGGDLPLWLPGSAHLSDFSGSSLGPS